MSMLHLTYQVPGDDFTRAGEASGDVKHKLKKLGYEPDAVRRVSIAMYEGEINMVIHAHGGTVTVTVEPDHIQMILADTRAPASPTWTRPCRPGGPPPRTTSAPWALGRAWACPT